MPISDDSLPPNGPTIRRAFEALATTLNERGIRYAVVGGLALIQHTRVRTTDDIDVLLTVPQVALPAFLEQLGKRGFSIDLQRAIHEFREHGLTTIQFADVLVDLLQPIVPALAHVLDRAVSAEILGQKVRISSAEGLVVMKLISLRPHDEADVQDIVAAYGDGLDLDFIRGELETFTQPGDERRVKFEAWVRRKT